MDTHDSFPFLKEIILFLALSGVLMPLLQLGLPDAFQHLDDPEVIASLYA